jgi:hypothetical protein
VSDHTQVVNFAHLRRALKLVVDDLDDNAPTDIAYAYSHSGCVKLYVVDVNTSRTPEESAYSPSWPNRLFLIIMARYYGLNVRIW